MNKEQVMGIIRHSLTAIGAVLTLKGFMDEATVLAIVGIVTTAVSAIWSIVDKTENNTLLKAENINRLKAELKKDL